MQKSTFQIGAALAVVVGGFLGWETSATYFLGVCFSVLYLYLLGAEIDTVGIGMSKSLLKQLND